MVNSMYQIGRVYFQLDGKEVLIVGKSNENTSYETVFSICSEGKPIHRYNRRDFGRCTGSSHSIPDPRNLRVL